MDTDMLIEAVLSRYDNLLTDLKGLVGQYSETKGGRDITIDLDDNLVRLYHCRSQIKADWRVLHRDLDDPELESLLLRLFDNAAAAVQTLIAEPDAVSSTNTHKKAETQQQCIKQLSDAVDSLSKLTLVVQDTIAWSSNDLQPVISLPISSRIHGSAPSTDHDQRASTSVAEASPGSRFLESVTTEFLSTKPLKHRVREQQPGHVNLTLNLSPHLEQDLGKPSIPVEREFWPGAVLEIFARFKRDDTSFTSRYGEPEAVVLPQALYDYYNRHRVLKFVESITFTQEVNHVDMADTIVNGDETPDRGYLRVLFILICMGQEHRIEDMFAEERLRDLYLPFEETMQLPDGIDTKSFCRFQRHFCAPVFAPRYHEQHLPAEYILPIEALELLSEGESWNVYRVRLHAEFDHLERSLQALNSHNYVFKIFHGSEGKQFYDAEVKAYRRLRAQGNFLPSLTRHYGSFIYKDKHIIILEYADNGTLEDFMKNKGPPIEAAAINDLWRQLFNLVQAVHRLHSASGWHQDIEPRNILVRRSPNHSEWPYVLMLADFGKSHFANETYDRVLYGTTDYGAPEHSHGTEYLQNAQTEILQTSDIWSLGAVWSEAAVWMAGGWFAVQNYRNDRRGEVWRATKVHRFSFHANNSILDCVNDIHKNISRQEDSIYYLTARVCKDLLKDMLRVNAEYRLTSAKVLEKTDELLDDTKRYFGASEHTYHLKSGTVISSITDPLIGTKLYSGASKTQQSKDSGYGSIDDARKMTAQSSLEYSEEHSRFKISTDSRNSDFADMDMMRSQSMDQKKYVKIEGPVPELSVHAARAWMDKKKRGVRDPYLNHSDRLKGKLEARDHVFIVDDSQSTYPIWDDICGLLSLLSFIVEDDDPDGMDLYFTNSSTFLEKTKSDKMFDLANDIRPRGLTNIEKAIKKPLEMYEQKLAWNDRLRRSEETREFVRPISIYVLTDGVWEGGDRGPEVPILGIVANLREFGLDREQIGIQFISFGNDARGLQHMQLVDDMKDAYGLTHDIVDTVRSNGNVWKMLLGAIDPIFDASKSCP